MRCPVLPLALVLLPVLAAPVAAQTVSPMVGQPSVSFNDDCGAGGLIGLEYRAGDWVDGIMVLCRRPDGSPGRFNFRGGMGGTRGSLYLQPDERIYRVLVWWQPPYVRGIQLQTNRQNANIGQLVGQLTQLASTEGEIISGFQLHTGQFLNGIAIITRPLPGAAPAPAPAPPPPPPPPPAAPTANIVQWSNGYSNLKGELTPPGIASTLESWSGRWEDRPAHWFEYRCQTGRPLTVRATSDWDNVLYVLSQSGQRMAYNDDTNGTNAQISWSCPDSATYLVGIAAFNPANVGMYSLELR